MKHQTEFPLIKSCAVRNKKFLLTPLRDSANFARYEVLRSPMSSDSYHFSDHLDYVNEYKHGLFKLAELDCQILLTPHPSQSKIRDRLSAPEGLIDSKGCMDYADNISKRLNNRLTKEKEKGSSSE